MEIQQDDVLAILGRLYVENLAIRQRLIEAEAQIVELKARIGPTG